jgi:hypothetical protein
MRLDLPLDDALSLAIGDKPVAGGYPTGRLQKGLLLADGEQELAEEGVGFGVPVLIRGRHTVFPGDLRLVQVRKARGWEVKATFTMNLVERLVGSGGGTVGSAPLYAVKDALAAAHRRSPLLRGPLTAVSSALRRVFSWETTYVETAPAGTVAVTYAARGPAASVHIAVDLGDLPTEGLTEVVVMNEQGARPFDHYRDSDGTALSGGAISEWREVRATEACFVCSDHGVAVCLRQAPPARLHRGRELVGSRLAWAGFAYVLPPAVGHFEYDVAIRRTG